MKNKVATSKSKLQTRAELINRSRASVALEKLPPSSDDMFDILKGFTQGTRGFINSPQINKP
jgi:hypothetical protein